MINYDNLAPKHTESKKTMDGTTAVYELSSTTALNMLKATQWNNIPGSVRVKLDSICGRMLTTKKRHFDSSHLFFRKKQISKQWWGPYNESELDLKEIYIL